MSDRMTDIALPGMWGAGWAEYGRKTVPEMVAEIRRFAADQKAAAEAILAASDDDFRVVTYVGVHARRKSEILQEGKCPTPK